MTGLRPRSRHFLVVLVVFCYVCSTTRADLRSCSDDKMEPCRFVIKNATDTGNGTSYHECLCHNNTCCHHSYMHPAYSINITTTMQKVPIHLKMKFCRRIDTLPLCGPSDFSLFFTKPTNKPIRVDYYKCRCQNYTDQRITFVNPHFVSYGYRCGHLPVCKAGQEYFQHTRRKWSEILCDCLPPMRKERITYQNTKPLCVNP